LNRRDQILDHYRQNWRADALPCSFSRGPVHDLPTDFSVVKFPPHAGRDMWTYATCCMSHPDDASQIELHVFSPAESPEIEEILFATAHFHRTGVRLDLGHTVNFGRPWIGSSDCEYGLISLPYLDGPELESASKNGLAAKFYWLIPITEAEKNFKARYGLEELEQRFDEAELDYLNPARASLV
jgi:Suppressor of fused protein (SUFU)